MFVSVNHSGDVVGVENVMLSSCSSMLLRCRKLAGRVAVQLHWSGYENRNEVRVCLSVFTMTHDRTTVSDYM